MLKNRNEQIQFMVRAVDLCLAPAAFFGAYWLRSSGVVPWAAGSIASIDSLAWMLATSVALHLLIYPSMGFYQSLRLRSIPEIVRMVVKAGVVEFLVLGSLVFIFQAKETSRYFVALFIALNYGFVLIEKLGIRVLLSSIRKRGFNYRQVLIVGTGQNARRLVASLRRNKHWGYVPFALLMEPHLSSSDLAGGEIDDVPVVGTLTDLEKVVLSRAVDEVYFALDEFRVDALAEQVYLCEKLGIPARFALGLFELPNSSVTFTTLDRLPVLTFYTTLMTPLEAAVKRTIDVVVALLGLLITASIYPWVAARIRRESPGPIVFKQIRVGENGRLFKCYKFRTMSLDAEARKAELQAKNQVQGPMFKIDQDPRVFPFGAFLRRTSLDELPQFLNILRGDMSVVGTRPPTPDEVRQYDLRFRRRLSIRPGLTGLWQVSGRSQIKAFEDVVKLDLQYIDQWSIWLDVRIIFRTIWVTLFRRGAY